MECVQPGCDEPTPGTWFCPFHTAVKEAAYAEARELGLNDYYAVIELRDRRLSEA